MTESPSQRETNAPNVSQPQADIHVMPDQFLALTRAKEIPRQVTSPVEKSSESAPAVVAASAVPTPSSTPKTTGLEQPKEPGMRRTLILWGAIGGGVIVIGGIIAFFVLRSVSPSAPVSAPGGSASGGNAPSVNTAPPAPVNEQPSAPASAPGGSASGGNVPPVEEPPPVVEPEVPANVDRDNDGLTDAEENVLGTDVSVADTDSDGYDDRTELLNLYNPTGTAPQKLLDAGLVFEYENPRDGWRVFVPRTWSIAATDQEQETVRISTDITGEFIEFQAIANPNALRLLDAVVQLTPSLTAPDPNDLETLTSKRGASGIRAFRTFGLRDTWFALGSSRMLMVRHIVQDLATGDVVRYPTLFDMIVQSVALAGAR